MFKGDQTNRTILESLPAFTEAVQKGLPVSIDKNRHWSVDGSVKRRVRLFFGLESSRKQFVVRSMIQILRSLERDPILFSRQKSLPMQQRYDYLSLIAAVEAVILHYQEISDISDLKRYFTALKYRLEKVNGGLDKKVVKQDVLDTLMGQALLWKENYETIEEKKLIYKEKRALSEVCAYREFAQLLVDDSVLRSEFFLWVIRDGNSVRPFIEFPDLQQEIVDCMLNGRIARQGGKGLKVQLENSASSIRQKVATLPFEGEDVSVLDRNREVVFRGNLKMTVGEIFQVFRDKYGDMGELEYLAEGIVNWNVFLWASWNAGRRCYDQVDLNRNGWWKELPVFEILTKKQAQKRYGDHLDGNIWNVAVVSTRGTLSMDFEDSHSFEEIAVPMGDGRYRIYPFGKWATEWPVTFFGKLSTVGKTLPATISSVDENVYYTFRQHTRHSFGLTPKQGMELMEGAKEDFINGLEGNFVYQIESENCARWVQLQIEKVVGKENVPNLFITSLLNAEPNGAVAALFNGIKKMPEKWQVKLLMFVHVPLGAFLGLWVQENGREVWKSLNHHEFWETGVVYLPAFLHNQKDRGLIDHATNLFLRLHDACKQFRSFIQSRFSDAEGFEIQEKKKFRPPVNSLPDKFSHTELIFQS